MSLPPTSVPANFSHAVIQECQNNPNSTRCSFDNKEWTFMITVYILIVAVLGIMFNLFVVMVFCLHKKACTVPEIYLSNLAAADFILSSFLPFWAVYTANKFSWPFGSTMCQIAALCIVMNAYCSIYFLVLVSIDRYLALVHPLSHERMRRPKYAKLACLLVWALGLLPGVPVLMYRKVEYNPCTNKYICFIAYPSTKIELLSEAMLITFSFIIPIFIISFCTFKIIRALNHRLNAQNTEHKATTLVLAVLLSFLVCWVPFHLVKIIEMLIIAKVLEGCDLYRHIEATKLIVIYLAFFNSVLNPILYVIVGKKFRKKVKEVFKQWSAGRTSTLSLNSVRSYLSRSDKSGDVSGRSARQQSFK
ncbi:B2 bradykinin receptor-like [Seriola dumerili]|uniref:Bradykinin receptor B2 n=1 Tax=Seriola dumerili TaxID=41447 RepID=A0A3B4USM3_SERDU|nr:B2 bradykinin receptor-like [Seriola dumerili]